MLGKFDQFIEEIDQAKSVECVRLALCRHLDILGFERFGYQLLRSPEGTRPGFFLTNYPPNWTEQYNNENLIGDDMVVRHSARATKPFTWDDIGDHRNFTAKQKAVFGEAESFGINSGGSIPMLGPQHAIALFAVASELSRDDFAKLFMDSRHELQLVANYAHTKLLFLRPYRLPQFDPMLTPREIEVITWLARGKSHWDISALLSISVPTVRKHANCAFKKLGTYNAAHAISIAVSNSLIMP